MPRVSVMPHHSSCPVRKHVVLAAKGVILSPQVLCTNVQIGDESEVDGDEAIVAPPLRLEH